MKPAIAWILAVLLLAGSTACERIPRYEGEVSEGKPAGGAGVSADSNQDYEEVTQLPEGEAMLASLEQLAAYLRQPQSTVDMYDPQAEDFWLILSLVTYAAHPDWESSFGTLDLKENVVKEIADIFFPGRGENKVLPATGTDGSAEYNKAEGLYELQPISISQGDTFFVTVEDLSGEGRTFEVTFTAATVKEGEEVGAWAFQLRRLAAAKSRYFNYRVEGIRPVEASEESEGGE